MVAFRFVRVVTILTMLLLTPTPEIGYFFTSTHHHVSMLVEAHTWMYTRARATMAASLDQPFRARKMEAGQHTHAQLGPGQNMVVRWASSHNNTFTLAIVRGKDEAFFWRKDYYKALDDYINSAPPGANVASSRPRYHGSVGGSAYIDGSDRKACANSYCVKDLFAGRMSESHPDFVAHSKDMGGRDSFTHRMWLYNADRIKGDKRMAYSNPKYPEIVAAYQYHNKVNMHHDWDLVHMDIPAVLASGHKAEHFIVHFSSRSPSDYTYTDALDVNLHPLAVPDEKIYGETTGTWGWFKMDHCQLTDPKRIVSPIRDATDSVEACMRDMDRKRKQDYFYGINTVPAVNPHVVPRQVLRAVETVSKACAAPACAEDTSGQCRDGDTSNELLPPLCTPPVRAFEVEWANPAVSGKDYTQSLKGVRVGEYLEWVWDDVLHDIWLMKDAGAAHSCDFTGAKRLYNPAHHSYDYKGGRALYEVPEKANGTSLFFACAVNGHCSTGQMLQVDISNEERVENPTLKKGVCPEGYELCPDQSIQGKVGALFETKANVPWADRRAAQSLHLSTEALSVSRARTPWEDWNHRRVRNSVCGWHTDGRDNPAWELTHATLQEAVEACSGNHPEICTGISWKKRKGAMGGQGDGDDTVAAAAVLADSDMYSGRHHFRRCLVSDGYTRVINVGMSKTKPYVKVPCPGCYQCREVAKPPSYTRYYKQSSYWVGVGMNFDFDARGEAHNNVTVYLPSPFWYHIYLKGYGIRWSWHFDLEIVCRVDAAVMPTPLEPSLDNSSDWDTFLLPPETPDTAELGAFTRGFDPARKVYQAKNATREQYNTAFPPGTQIDPSVTGDDVGDDNGEIWVPKNRRDYRDPGYKPSLLPPPAEDVGPAPGPAAADKRSSHFYWPPLPQAKVSFMPRGRCNAGRDQVIEPDCGTLEGIAAIQNSTRSQGWMISHGQLFANGAGWRCEPIMSWHGHNYHNVKGSYFSPFAYGNTRQVGEHYHGSSRTTYPTCLDGEPNAFEIEVPNAVYQVTAGFDLSMAQPAWMGCNFENVRAFNKWPRGPQRSVMDQVPGQGTIVLTVEVLDGRFTLSGTKGERCANVNWFKLDRLTPGAHPKPWLPAPRREWWQANIVPESAAGTANGEIDVGLVEVALPLVPGISFESYPNVRGTHMQDCREWWLFKPAQSCLRAQTIGAQRGSHPELVHYPDFPGFTPDFLGAYFDLHDLDGDGNLTKSEYMTESPKHKAAVSEFHRPYGWWTADTASKIFGKIDQAPHDPLEPPPPRNGKVSGLHDGVITREHFINGLFAGQRDNWCDHFSSWSGYPASFCSKRSGATMIPEPQGIFPNDGRHGLVVAVSNTPCTDADGCDTSDEQICQLVRSTREIRGTWRNAYNQKQTGPVQVDCQGKRGKYVRIRLPGNDNERMLPAAATVRVHRNSWPSNATSAVVGAPAPLATEPRRPMVCYGVEMKPPPKAADPDVLIETKKHAMTFALDNPEDPIYYSTCYIRALIKDWIPLSASSSEEEEERDGQGGAEPWKLADGKYCLACDCLDAHKLRANNASRAFETPSWWLNTVGVPCLSCGDTNGAGARGSAGAGAADNVERGLAHSYVITLQLTSSLASEPRRIFLEAMQALLAKYRAHSGVSHAEVSPANRYNDSSTFVLNVKDTNGVLAAQQQIVSAARAESDLVLLITDEYMRETVAKSLEATLSTSVAEPDTTAVSTTTGDTAGESASSSSDVYIYAGAGAGAGLVLLSALALALIVVRRRRLKPHAVAVLEEIDLSETFDAPAIMSDEGEEPNVSSWVNKDMAVSESGSKLDAAVSKKDEEVVVFSLSEIYEPNDETTAQKESQAASLASLTVPVRDASSATAFRKSLRNSQDTSENLVLKGELSC